MKQVRARLPRAAAAAYWIAPSLFLLWLYWDGLLAWFTQDDFAWLGLRMKIYTWRDFLTAMFAPMAQGTIRPWSERGFFMLFSWLFGLDSLPFRLWVFATQSANLVLLCSITRRLTGSAAAGFWAPVLWTANSVLAVAMSWNSAYNQILCAFFLLLAFHWFLKYTETGLRRYYALQWAAFLLGFGALEVNVIYPALACLYSICRARRYVASTLPMFAVSAGYAILHTALAPKPKTGVYALHLDWSVFDSLMTYWSWAMGPSRYILIEPEYTPLAPFASWFLTLVLLGFAVWKVRRREWLPLFFLGWFVVVLAPVLLLRAHLSEYYLTIPVAGLAALGAWALADAWRTGWLWRSVAAFAAILYLATAIPVAREVALWRRQRSENVHRLVLGVERASQLHPGKAILLADVPSDLFWIGVFDQPFRLLGIRNVYLAPGSERAIDSNPHLGDIREHVFPAEILRRTLHSGQAVVYSAEGPRLRNITSHFLKTSSSPPEGGESKMVDAGNPIFKDQLGPGWYPIEAGYRWTSRRATVRLGAPAAGEKLYTSGFCPAQQFEQGPLGIRVRLNGRDLGQSILQPRPGPFELVWALPSVAARGRSIEIEIEVARTISPPEDGRELGLAFGKIALRP